MNPDASGLGITEAVEMPLSGVLLGAIVAALVSAALVPVAIRWARHWSIMDGPNHRKDQLEAVPRLGGIAIAGGFAAGLLTAGLLAAALTDSFSSMHRHWFACSSVFVIATTLIFVVGLLDDILKISVRSKFAAQILAAVLVVANGHAFTRISWPFGDPIELGVWGSVFAVVWIVGITNAVNLMDGLDGLAGGVTAISAASLLAFAAIQGETSSMAVAACLFGAAVGFLPFNWSPARIYLGDAGSLTLGFVLASVSLTASLKSSTAIAVFVPILALGIPAIDTVLVMSVRFLESPGHPILRRLSRMFQADRRHLHHLVLALAKRRSRVVMSLYALVAVFCFLAVMAALDHNPTMAVAILLVEILVVIFIRQSGMRAQARALAYAQRESVKAEFGIETEPSGAVAELEQTP